MKVDAPLVTQALSAVPESAREIEAMGYDGVYTFEGPHDPFFPLALAAEHTERIDLATAIAVGFARSPMNLAHIGWDLQTFSQGRAILGLGSQIKPHIEKRFSMPWSRPAAAHARDGARNPRDLGVVAGRHPAQVRRRDLPPHVDDSLLHPRAERRRNRAHLRRGRR